MALAAAPAGIRVLSFDGDVLEIRRDPPLASKAGPAAESGDRNSNGNSSEKGTKHEFSQVFLQQVPWQSWPVGNNSCGHWGLDQWSHTLPFPEKLMRKEKFRGPSMAGGHDHAKEFRLADILHVQEEGYYNTDAGAMEQQVDEVGTTRRCRPNKNKRLRLRHMVRKMFADGLTLDDLPPKITKNPKSLSLVINLWKMAAEDRIIPENPESAREPEDEVGTVDL